MDVVQPMPVKVRVDGAPREAWRINMMPAGDGSFLLCLHATVSEASGTKVGDLVSVSIELDREYRGGPVHAMPPGLAAGLRRNAGARGAWEALVPNRKKEVLRYFASLKSKEALERNIARVLRSLRGAEDGR